MPADTRLPTPFPPYTPGARRRDRVRALLARLTAKDILFGLLAILVALGWTVSSPGKRIDALDVRVLHTEKRIDTLADQQRFTNYLLCVQIRRTDPFSVPPECPPIIDARKPK